MKKTIIYTLTIMILSTIVFPLGVKAEGAKYTVRVVFFASPVKKTQPASAENHFEEVQEYGGKDVGVYAHYFNTGMEENTTTGDIIKTLEVPEYDTTDPAVKRKFKCWASEEDTEKCVDSIDIKAANGAEGETSTLTITKNYYAIWEDDSGHQIVEKNETGVSDVDDVMETFDEYANAKDEIAGTKVSNKDEGEKVNVPDTAANKSLITIIIGSLIVILGIGTVYYKVKKQN